MFDILTNPWFLVGAWLCAGSIGVAVGLYLSRTRTPDERPEQSHHHTGADERWSPRATVAAVPERPINADEAALRDADTLLNSQLNTIEHNFREALSKLLEQDIPTATFTTADLRAAFVRAGRR